MNKEEIIVMDGPFGVPVVNIPTPTPRDEVIMLGIIGPRKRNNKYDKLKVRNKILEMKPTVIVTGDCKRGGDKFGRFYAERFGIKLVVYEADIDDGMTYQEKVNEYYRRNKLVAKTATHLYALVSKDRRGGTEYTIKQFKKTHRDWKKRLFLDE